MTTAVEKCVIGSKGGGAGRDRDRAHGRDRERREREPGAPLKVSGVADVGREVDGLPDDTLAFTDSVAVATGVGVGDPGSRVGVTPSTSRKGRKASKKEGAADIRLAFDRSIGSAQVSGNEIENTLASVKTQQQEQEAIAEAIAGNADTGSLESDCGSGLSRYRDPATQSLAVLASTWESLYKTWQAAERRAASSPHLSNLTTTAGALKSLRDKVGVEMTRNLKSHPLWSWLSLHPGVRGVHVCRIIGMIGDPLRFPGRVCTSGHHLPADWTGPCPHRVERDGDWNHACGADVGAVRSGTGTRALWHYLGLHVVEGHLARKRKGYQASWNPAGRTALLQPDGVADQIIKQRTEPWRTVYDQTKERLIRERGAAVGPDGGGQGVIESGDASEVASGLRPVQIHSIARTVAVKAFVADLLTAWKAAL